MARGVAKPWGLQWGRQGGPLSLRPARACFGGALGLPQLRKLWGTGLRSGFLGSLAAGLGRAPASPSSACRLYGEHHAPSPEWFQAGGLSSVAAPRSPQAVGGFVGGDVPSSSPPTLAASADLAGGKAGVAAYKARLLVSPGPAEELLCVLQVRPEQLPCHLPSGLSVTGRHAATHCTCVQALS